MCCSPWGHKESDTPWWVNRARNTGGAQPSKFLPEFTTSWMFMSFRAIRCALLDEGQGWKESGFTPTTDSSTQTLRNIRGNNILETEHLPFYSGCEDMEAWEVICPQWDVSGLLYRTHLTIPCCVFDSLSNSTSRPGAVSLLSLSWEYQCHQHHWCGSDC